MRDDLIFRPWPLDNSKSSIRLSSLLPSARGSPIDVSWCFLFGLIWRYLDRSSRHPLPTIGCHCTSRRKTAMLRLCRCEVASCEGNFWGIHGGARCSACCNQRVLEDSSSVSHDLGMDQYLLIPFLVGWTSIYQLFWCSPGVQGFDPSPSHKL